MEYQKKIDKMEFIDYWYTRGLFCKQDWKNTVHDRQAFHFKSSLRNKTHLQ